jgi:asparagine synthase (glutamine-hydrolysing)
MPIPELLKRRVYSDELLLINKINNPMNYARKLYDEVREYSLLDKILYFDTLSYAVDDLMIKVERMTMAHGLQAYTPFHDLELIEFVASLPTHMKIKGLERKYVMKEALRPYLPEHTLVKKKKGFDMPLEELLIKKYPEYVKDILLDPLTLNRGYFNKNNFKKLVENFLKVKTDYASGSPATIISLLTLELWHRLFIDN